MLLDSLYTLYIPFETWRPKLFATQGHEGGIDYLSNLGYAITSCQNLLHPSASERPAVQINSSKYMYVDIIRQLSTEFIPMPMFLNFCNIMQKPLLYIFLYVYHGFQILLEVSFPVRSVSVQTMFRVWDGYCHAYMHKTELASSDSNVDNLWPKPRSEHAALETAQNRSRSAFEDAHWP